MRLLRPSDFFINALCLTLALGCSGFAGYKIVALQGMEDPPADLGLNFPLKKERHTEAVLVDPLVTGSIGVDDAGASSRVPPVQPYTNDSPVINYRLLSVIDGIAFVELTKLKGKEIWPVSEGATLPGAGQVSRIERVDGRWQVTAGSEKIVSDLQ